MTKRKSSLDDNLKKLSTVPPDPVFYTRGFKISESWNPNRKSGHLHMTFPDVGVEMMDTKTHKKVGHVYGCLGGGVEIRIGEYTYSLKFTEIWDAVSELHNSRVK